MKTNTNHSGLLLTALLIIVLILAGRFTKSEAVTTDGVIHNEQSSSSKAHSNLNLKGMTRHLLDFYK